MMFEKGLIGFSAGTAPSKSLRAKVGEKVRPIRELTPEEIEQLRDEALTLARENDASPEQLKYLETFDTENPPAEPPPGWPKDVEWPFADNQ